MNKTISPNITLINKVRAGFVSKGTTLHRWCVNNNVLYPNARQALMGSWNGPKGMQLRQLLLEESGILELGE